MQKVKDEGALRRYCAKLLSTGVDLGFLTGYPLELLRFSRGEFLCRLDEPMPYMLLLVQGRAKVFCVVESGKSLLFAFIEGIQVVGDLELAAELTGRNCVQAITDAYCLGIPVAACRDKMLLDTEFLRFISRELAKKLVNCSSNYAANMLYPLECRLASYMLHTEENGIFTEHLGALADILGASYRHLLRVLQAFVQSGTIKKHQNGYRILDHAALKKLGKDIYRY